MQLLQRMTLMLLVVMIGQACTKDDRPVEVRYAEQLAAGLASKERTDELFLGLKLGMTAPEFFDHCTELNKQRLITEGEGGRTVRYNMEALSEPGHMIFAPEFSKPEPGEKARVQAMNFKVKYEAWAPWNEEFNNLNLLKDLTRVMIDQYGDGFLAVPHEKAGRVVTQVKNNRRIALWLEGKEYVRGRMTDLSRLPDDPLWPNDRPTIPNAPQLAPTSR